MNVEIDLFQLTLRNTFLCFYITMQNGYEVKVFLASKTV